MTDMDTLAPAEIPTLLDRVRWKVGSIRHHSVRFWRGACDQLRWLGHQEGNIESHARHELTLAGWFEKDGLYGDMMGHAVMKMLREFASEGHSGMSAGVAVGLFKKVAMFEPLLPLTGNDDEWREVGAGVWQNKRCSHVFKEVDVDGPRAYDSEGKVFREPDGCCYTSRDSRTYITFPYIPTTVYVDAPKTEA